MYEKLYLNKAIVRFSLAMTLFSAVFGVFLAIVLIDTLSSSRRVDEDGILLVLAMSAALLASSAFFYSFMMRYRKERVEISDEGIRIKDTGLITWAEISDVSSGIVTNQPAIIANNSLLLQIERLDQVNNVRKTESFLISKKHSSRVIQIIRKQCPNLPCWKTKTTDESNV